LRPRDILGWLVRIWADARLKRQINRVESYLLALEMKQPLQGQPVLFFNASTRIHRLSINGAFGLLSAWAIRAVGVPVVYAFCERGMRQCMLGTNRIDLLASPPCKHCVAFSRLLFSPDRVFPLNFGLDQAEKLEEDLIGQSLPSMMTWEVEGLPLGELCLPSFRWALRRHHLEDDEATRALFRRYLLSAANLVEAFDGLMDRIQPRRLVVFNGITFPEAVARRVAFRKGIEVVTHEVGMRAYSAFFSHEDATFREIDLRSDGSLSDEEEGQLANYLEERFQGKFSMAGIRFWPEMSPLPDWIRECMQTHRQMVPIFTNVIFDTSQIHANALYEDMFAWLDDLKEVIRRHPDTLFILRAHPDEDRPGKESQESVAEWFFHSGLEAQPNVIFLPPSQSISSYELVHQAKFIAVYNSSIGLEAAIMEKLVLCAGRARYTQAPTVFFPASRKEYLSEFEKMLRAEAIHIPQEFAANGRRFLYEELYRASLDLSEFIRPYPRQKGMILFTDFEPARLLLSPALDVIREGILKGKPFLYP